MGTPSLALGSQGASGAISGAFSGILMEVGVSVSRSAPALLSPKAEKTSFPNVDGGSQPSPPQGSRRRRSWCRRKIEATQRPGSCWADATCSQHDGQGCKRLNALRIRDAA